MREARWLLVACLLGSVACAGILGIEEAKLAPVDAGGDPGDAPRPPAPCGDGGCSPEKLVATSISEGAVVVEGSYLVWGEETGTGSLDVRACELPDCARPAHVAYASSFAVAAGAVYFVELPDSGFGGPIRVQSLSGGASRTVSSSAHAQTIYAASASEVIFESFEASDSGIARRLGACATDDGVRRDVIDLETGLRSRAHPRKG